jgi:predicted HTH domain antitoxin
MSIATSIEIPESIVLSLRKSVGSIGLEMKQALAVRYYTDRKLSLGQCAELAEMSEKSFINHLSTYSISIFAFDSESELLEDIANA